MCRWRVYDGHTYKENPMRPLILAILASLLISSPVSAITDYCPNLPGLQKSVPAGYILVVPVGDGLPGYIIVSEPIFGAICIPAP
jgi:hypothetical protein